MYTSREMTKIYQSQEHIPHSSRNVNIIRHNACQVTSNSVDVNLRLYRRRPQQFEVPFATRDLLNLEESAMTDMTRARLCSAGRVYCGNNMLNLHKQLYNTPKSALYTYTWSSTTASQTLPSIRRSIAGSRRSSKFRTIHSSRGKPSSILARPSSIFARPLSTTARPFTIPAIPLPTPTEPKVPNQEPPDLLERNLKGVLPPVTASASTGRASPQIQPDSQQISPKSRITSSVEGDSDSLSHGSDLTQDKTRKVKHATRKRSVDKTPVIARDSRDKEDVADLRFQRLRNISSGSDYSSD